MLNVVVKYFRAAGKLHLKQGNGENSHLSKGI